ncbi:MAG: peptidase [Pirellulaceae bacterium]|nr:peptidase [Pirellulaceae bacterium]
MLQEPQLSGADLQFKLFGFPVRVAWGFWILAAVLGWQESQIIDEVYRAADRATPGAAPLLVILAAALLLSILVHELGHCLLFRHFGTDSRIVLYHFGGLAIPGRFTDWNAARRRFTDRPRDLIAISAAGPIAQFLFGLLVWGLATAAHVRVGLTDFLEQFVVLPLPETTYSESAIIHIFADTLVNTSVYWAVLTLLPIMPLDGGQIMREIMRIFRVANPVYTAAIVSMFVAGALGLYMFQSQRSGAGLMCLALMASNYQIMQSSRYGGY